MPDGFAGTSWVGFEIDIEEDEPDAQAELTAVVMTFKTKPDLTGAAALTRSGGDGLTIVSASPPWKVGIDDIATVGLAAGVYFFDIKFTDSSGITEPLLRGTWRILPTA
jgi:hypothetical protein